MIQLESNQSVSLCDGVNRRDFLTIGGLALGLGLTELTQLRQTQARESSREKACIQLFLVGGPGHLDTWDLKPDAPESIRGPFRPTATNVPGIRISEHFPRMAQRADRFAILRSLFHKEAPIHETGHQLMQTGHLFQGGVEWPHFGAVVGKLSTHAVSTPPWVVLPNKIGNTGVSISHGQGAGFLEKKHGPLFVEHCSVASTDNLADLNRRDSLVDCLDVVQAGVEPRAGIGLTSLFRDDVKKALDLREEPESVRSRYGRNTFGQSCLLARRLIQHGVRLVTVNMFETVFGQITWDCHANGGDLCSSLDDYRTTLCPMLDVAYSALLDDLESLGLLDTTLVMAAGEFGRTPKINARGGRDHWPGVWSALLAGGGVRGGQVIGASDSHGGEPADRPIHPSELAATVYHSLGIDPRTRLQMPDGRSVPLVDADAIEVF